MYRSHIPAWLREAVEFVPFWNITQPHQGNACIIAVRMKQLKRVREDISWVGNDRGFLSDEPGKIVSCALLSKQPSLHLKSFLQRQVSQNQMSKPEPKAKFFHFPKQWKISKTWIMKRLDITDCHELLQCDCVDTVNSVSQSIVWWINTYFVQFSFLKIYIKGRRKPRKVFIMIHSMFYGNWHVKLTVACETQWSRTQMYLQAIALPDIAWQEQMQAERWKSDVTPPRRHAGVRSFSPTPTECVSVLSLRSHLAKWMKILSSCILLRKLGSSLGRERQEELKMRLLSGSLGFFFWAPSWGRTSGVVEALKRSGCGEGNESDS